MNKYCYICGKPILKGNYYYNIGGNSFVCENEECYKKYYWDKLAAQIVVDNFHEYAIVNQIVYQIGSELDDPKGLGGKYWKIKFNDDKIVETTSLWICGKLPNEIKLSDNAIFLPH